MTEKPVKALATIPATTSKAKKVPAVKKVRSHPTYFEIIKEAIVVLKQRIGPSPYAITKCTKVKQLDLPTNFKKLLSIQLKKLMAWEKQMKLKNSFNLGALK